MLHVNTMKYILAFLGSTSLFLGILGIFLPLLPTTPFLLLSAALYLRSSPKLYNWLLSHPYFGPYIKNFRENKAIPLRVKIVSVCLLWGTLLYCAFGIADALWLRCMFIALATAITVHILHYKTLR